MGEAENELRDVPRWIARERVPWQWEEICTSSLILTRMGDRGK
jgi:hypothetical protein